MEIWLLYIRFHFILGIVPKFLLFCISSYFHLDIVNSIMKITNKTFHPVSPFINTNKCLAGSVWKESLDFIGMVFSKGLRCWILTAGKVSSLHLLFLNFVLFRNPLYVFIFLSFLFEMFGTSVSCGITNYFTRQNDNTSLIKTILSGFMVVKFLWP